MLEKLIARVFTALSGPIVNSECKRRLPKRICKYVAKAMLARRRRELRAIQSASRLAGGHYTVAT